jgi:hypothetical protein
MALVSGGGFGGASNTVNPAGTGSTLNYIGNHVYGISGIVGVNNSEVSLMEFTTGGDAYLKVDIQIMNESGSNEDFRYKVFLNNEVVGSWYFVSAANIPEPTNPYKLIIPAGSKVKITAENQTSTTLRNHTATITGRVYA